MTQRKCRIKESNRTGKEELSKFVRIYEQPIVAQLVSTLLSFHGTLFGSQWVEGNKKNSSEHGNETCIASRRGNGERN
jgi:hypothetical protein